MDEAGGGAGRPSAAGMTGERLEELSERNADLVRDIEKELTELLAAKGIAARVISVPAFELFDKQSPEYQASVLGTAKVKVGIEAAIRQGWDHFIGADGIFIGMKGFGESAPYKELYKHFGITAEAVVEAVSARLG